ncbi:methyl-accepting chemotaxis protein, partial [Vibrio splendidus]|uniref:methyl-accepting chemotaxis protein n=1 Tax=Vibrio splendidus TaxID=29497 RepID=UPI001966ED41
MKFSYKIAMVSSLLLLLTISFLSIEQYISVSHTVEHGTTSSINDIMGSVKNNIAADLSGRIQLAKYTTSLIDSDPSKEAIARIINQTPLKDTFLMVGGGLEVDGKAFSNNPSWILEENYDARIRPWYMDAKAQNGLIVTAPYIDAASNTLLVSIALPIKKNGQFIGATFYDMSLAGLAEVVNQVDLFGAGTLFIVDIDGTTIAHPKTENNGKRLSSYLPGINISQQQQSLEIDGVRYGFKFEKVPNVDWYVGVQLNENIAFSAVDEIRSHSFLYATIAVIISVIVLLFIIHKLMSPLAALNNAIQAIASGQGDLTQRLNSDTDPEFAQLADGFNQFTESLQKQITQLKEINGEVKQGITNTLDAAAGSASAVTTQLQELEQLATAMNEMAATANDVAGNAQSAAAETQEAENATQHGANAVNTTTASINQLSERIDQAVAEVQVLEIATDDIEKVLQVINDIADQTN